MLEKDALTVKSVKSRNYNHCFVDYRKKLLLYQGFMKKKNFKFRGFVSKVRGHIVF